MKSLYCLFHAFGSHSYLERRFIDVVDAALGVQPKDSLVHRGSLWVRNQAHIITKIHHQLIVTRYPPQTVITLD